jgi:hypothetical protein
VNDAGVRNRARIAGALQERTLSGAAFDEGELRRRQRNRQRETRHSSPGAKVSDRASPAHFLQIERNQGVGKMIVERAEWIANGGRSRWIADQ